MLARYLIPLVMLGLGAASALACPVPTMPGMNQYSVTGRDLWSPNRYPVQAGGRWHLMGCGFGFAGHVREPPDFVFRLTGLRRYDRLHIRANAACDTVLLVHTATQAWYFDDDSGTGRTASISIADPADGRYAIWVGSYHTQGCDAALTLETF